MPRRVVENSVLPIFQMRSWILNAMGIIILGFLQLGLATEVIHANPSKSDTAWVFIFAGQSNMVGQGRKSELNPNEIEGVPNIKIWNANKNKWGTISNVLNTQFGPEVGAAYALEAKYPTKSIRFIKLAVGGTGLAVDWDPEKSGSLYDKLIQQVHSALKDLRNNQFRFQIKAIFWMQGEQDSKDSRHPEHANAYGQNLNNLIDKFRNDLNHPELPFIFGRIHNKLIHAKPHAGLDFGQANVVRRAMAKVDSIEAHTVMINTDDLPLIADQIHFNTKGDLLLGNRFVQAWMSLN